MGELSAGIGLLVGLWGDALHLFNPELCDLAKALIVVAGCGLMTLAIVAASMHKYIDDSPGANGCLSVLLVFFVLIRIFVNGPGSWANQLLCTVLCGLVLVVAFIALIVNQIRGIHQDSVKNENEQLQKM